MTTAFIFIEFQNDFCTDGGKLYGLVRDEIARNRTVPNAQRLLAAARERGDWVIHCPFALDAERVRGLESRGILSGILAGDIFAPGSWGHAIIDDLRPLDGEHVLRGKNALSAFSGTELRAELERRGVRNLVICGFLTNICVQATAMSAYDLGLTTYVAFDACGAATEEIQRFTEANLAPLLGTPASVDAILAEL